MCLTEDRELKEYVANVIHDKLARLDSQVIDPRVSQTDSFNQEMSGCGILLGPGRRVLRDCLSSWVLPLHQSELAICGGYVGREGGIIASYCLHVSLHRHQPWYLCRLDRERRE